MQQRHSAGLILCPMARTRNQPNTVVSRREINALPDPEPLDAPELTFLSRGKPDPRLVHLARLLGRQFARETFNAQMKGGQPDAPR